MPVLEAPITAVTVYTNCARVTRQGSISLEPGEHTLIIDTLPETLEEDSVRVSGTGTGVTLLGVDVKREVISTPEDAASELTRRTEALTRDKQVEEDKLETLKLRLAMLKTVAEHSTARFGATLASGRITPEKVTELSDYIEQQRDTLQARMREVEDRIRTLTAEIDLLVTQDSSIRQEKFKPIIQLHIAVRVTAAVNFTLEASYIVRQASWTPLYDVRLHEDNDVELTYLATITQRTGEDWNTVAMALSTARPAFSIKLPQLKAWYIGETPPPQPRYRAQQRLAEEKKSARFYDEIQAAKPAAAPDFDNMSPEEIMKWMESLAQRQGATEGFTTGADMAELQTTQVAPSGASVTYNIGTPVSVPSDGTPHKTGVVITRLSAKLDYLSVPKIALEAYLRATITNTSEYTLLPGLASIFHGDEFVGKTAIKTTAPGEEFKVQLGVDDRIKIERELVNREVSKRFIGNLRRILYAYKITVTNLLPEAAKITLSDQLPVSQHEQIRVQPETIHPEPSEQTDLNVLTWTFDLAAGAAQNIMMSFTVEHSRGINVAGLVE